MPVRCGHLRNLLLLAAACCQVGLSLTDRPQPRATRKICGAAFDSMYWSDACDLLGKRSEVSPLISKRNFMTPFQLAAAEQEDDERSDNALEYRPSPKFGRRRHRLSERYNEIDVDGGSGPRLGWLVSRWTSPRKRSLASKRSPEHYKLLHDRCCSKGCHEGHFIGIC